MPEHLDPEFKRRGGESFCLSLRPHLPSTLGFIYAWRGSFCYDVAQLQVR
ncbi:hypothetical protein D082_08180 [Synechocystis sp. PCC 6714]|nr:hypothetical protein D082_08180 [Synechocystis sp. PCC 6714]